MVRQVTNDEVGARVRVGPSENVLTIQVTGRDEGLSLRSLIQVLRDAIEILEELDASISDIHKPTLKWNVIGVGLNGSLTMTIEGEPVSDLAYSVGVVPTYIEGLNRLERGEEVPQHFTEAALTSAKDLVATFNDGVSAVVFSSPAAGTAAPTQHLAANVDAFLRRSHYYETTTLDGLLEGMNVHGKYKFSIYNRFTGAETRCKFPRDQYDKAHAAMRKRVAVTGRVKYARDGRAVSMDAHDFRVIPDQDRLPQFNDLKGMGITGGIDPTEYIRGLRDDD